MANRLEGPVGYELKRTQHVLRLRMDDALRGIGLTTPQYAVLSLLESNPGLSNAELARRAFVTAQTMNAIVAKLAATSLLQRRPHPTHGRVQETLLTKQGQHALGLAHPLVDAIEGRMLARLGRDEQRHFLTMLRDCASALENDGGD